MVRETPHPVGLSRALDEYGYRSDNGRGEARMYDPRLLEIDSNVGIMFPSVASLNESEQRALGWLNERYSHPVLLRPTCGVDFVSGSVGIEVKSRKDYSLTELQEQHCELLDFVFVVVSRDGTVWLEECFVDRHDTVRVRG